MVVFLIMMRLLSLKLYLMIVVAWFCLKCITALTCVAYTSEASIVRCDWHFLQGDGTPSNEVG